MAPPKMLTAVRQAVRPSRPISTVANLPRVSRRGLVASTGLLAGSSLLAGGLLGWNNKTIQCEPVVTEPPLNVPEAKPKSIVNVYQLSFGTICGLCAGIFIKKGLKFIAFLLGGCYVFVQYLASKRLVKIDWNSLKGSYNKSINSLAGPVEDAGHGRFDKMPLVRIWRRLVDFLTSDFQERATFLAGLVLGLRLG